VALFGLLLIPACHGALSPSEVCLQQRGGGTRVKRYEEQECRRKQGDWTRQGMRGIYGCVLKAADAGKACNSGSDCQFCRCVDTERGHLPGTRQTGQCAATDSRFGCYRLVENGEVMPGICAD
jgi:hypothetical protein